MAAVCGLLAGTACADGIEAEYKAHKDKALAKHAQAYAQLASKADLRPFAERVGLVDEVAILLARRMTSTKTQVLDDVLKEILDSKKSVVAADAPRIVATAVDIYGEYVDRFQQEIQAPAVSHDGLAFLKQYYTDTIRAACDFVFQRGKVAAAAAPKAADEVAQLCAVLPLMETPEGSWSRQNVASLPPHMQGHQALAALEELAVQLRRPVTACQFAQADAGATWGAARIHQYFVSAAADRKKRRQYLPAASYLKAAVVHAEADKNLRASAGGLRIQLAELYDEMAHPELAAQTLAEMMQEHPADEDWGKAAMLRLKYLYSYGGFEEVVADGTRYVADKRAGGFGMQINYILWVTHRRLNHAEAAVRIQQEFIKSCPESTLCADMYFASAMTALAEGNYAEAGRILELIEYRYPKAPIAAKVKQIQERLKGLSNK
jgi:tetratricopeptide (TPR) repeat protein